MKTKNLLFLLFFMLLFVTSCQKDDTTDTITNQKVLTEEHIEFLNAWEVNSNEAIIERKKDIDGVYQDYIVSHDIEIPLSEFDIWKSNKNSNNPAKQYRSRYTVASAYRDITIVIDPSLSRNQKEAVAGAIESFNRLGNSIKMSLSYSGNGNIRVATSSNIGNATARSGFPLSNGKPYPLIRVASSSANYPIYWLKPLLIHELGHCIGLRHQDFRTRSSCDGIQPSEQGYIAHIPGTPTSEEEPSIMLACLRNSTSTIIDLTDSDIKALNSIY